MGSIFSILIHKPLIPEKATKYVNCFFLNVLDQKIIWVCEARKPQQQDILIPVWVFSSRRIFLAEMTKQKADNARAANTLNSYESDWNDFKDWCAQKNLSFLPAARVR